MSEIDELKEQLRIANIKARRYDFLSGRSRKRARSFTSPYVVDPNKSRLHAVATYTPDNLDAAVDLDMLEDMSNFVYQEKLVEGDVRFADPKFQFSDEFAAECENEARQILANQF